VVVQAAAAWPAPPPPPPPTLLLLLLLLLLPSVLLVGLDAAAAAAALDPASKLLLLPGPESPEILSATSDMSCPCRASAAFTSAAGQVSSSTLHTLSSGSGCSAPLTMLTHTRVPF
jgi:hypothetical protein